MPFTEDLSVYLDPVNGFATAATYDGVTPVNVIFDRAYLDTLGMASTDPVALGKASDFPETTSIGKTLLIGATTWTIRNRQPQDDGAFVLLQLTDG